MAPADTPGFSPKPDPVVQPLSLKDKRVLVTGGTTGIGRACVLALAQAGARILTFGRHQAELDDTLKDARAQNGRVFGLTADVALRDDVERVFTEVDRQLGGLDILVNNAAVKIGTVQDTAEDEWRYAVETDFVGYLACAKAAIDRLQDKGGHLVFIGSLAAEAKGPSTSVYAGIKAGIETYAKTLRKELIDKNIRVSVVEPGLVGADLQGIPVEQQREREGKREMIYAEDIADAVCFVLTRPERTSVSLIQVEPIKQKSV